MKVVLKGNVAGLGRRGDIVDVADGYSRNYLIPQGLAMRATAGTEREAELMRRVEQARDAKSRGAAQALATRLGAVPMVISARAGAEGRLFGSVTVTDIVGAAAAAGVEIERRSVMLPEPIKELGAHSVTVELHPDVKMAISVSVVPE